MKKMIMMMVMLLAVTASFGQNSYNGKVEGIAIDKQSGQTLGYVAVTLLDAEHNYVKGFLSTMHGYFLLEGLAYGRYYLKISNTGYEDMIIPVFVSQEFPNVVIGPIPMKARSQQLLGKTTFTKLNLVQARIQ